MDDQPARDLLSLPHEIILEILRHVDSCPPSVDNFDQAPTLKLTHRQEQPLKLLSTLSRAWRKAVISTLFSHLQLWAPTAMPEVPITNAWILDCLRQPDPIPDIQAFIGRHPGLGSCVRSLVIRDDRVASNERQVSRLNYLKCFWNAIAAAFPRLNRIVIAAPPLSVSLWAGLALPISISEQSPVPDTPIHYLELRMDVIQALHGEWQLDMPLHRRRRWTHLGYNEGLHQPVQSDQDQRREFPPSALNSLAIEFESQSRRLSRCSRPDRCIPRIESFRYVAVPSPTVDRIRWLAKQFIPALGSDLQNLRFSLGTLAPTQQEPTRRASVMRARREELRRQLGDLIRYVFETSRTSNHISTSLEHEKISGINLDSFTGPYLNPWLQWKEVGSSIIWTNLDSGDA
jgi:hypothetical protein